MTSFKSSLQQTYVQQMSQQASHVSRIATPIRTVHIAGWDCQWRWGAQSGEACAAGGYV